MPLKVISHGIIPLFLQPTAKGVVQVYQKVDPNQKFVKDKEWLADDVGESSVALYLGTFAVYESRSTKDSLEVASKRRTCPAEFG